MILTHKITVANTYNINNVNEVEIRKSAAQLSDSATIKLPRRGGNTVYSLPEPIKRGAAVSIALGYDGKNVPEFNGYIDSIKTDKDIEIICEDGAYLLRKPVKNNQYKAVTVGNLIGDIVAQLDGVTAVVSDQLAPLKYDKFTTKDATAYEVLTKVMEEWRIHIYVRNSVVYAGLKFELKDGEVRYDFGRNVEKANLKFETADSRKVRVEVVGIDKNNKKVSVEVGDKDSSADRIKINRYNVTDVKALETIGEEEMVKWKKTGYAGSITTWLLPQCTYGYAATIVDDDYPSREGKYYVAAVTTTYNDSGGKRKVNLGLKLS